MSTENLSWRSAVLKVLADAGGPLHYTEVRVDSGKGQNRTLRSLSAFWPPVFASEQDVGPPKG